MPAVSGTTAAGTAVVGTWSQRMLACGGRFLGKETDRSAAQCRRAGRQMTDGDHGGSRPIMDDGCRPVVDGGSRPVMNEGSRPTVDDFFLGMPSARSFGMLRNVLRGGRRGRGEMGEKFGNGEGGR